MGHSEEKINKAKKYNAKLFPIYKMFSWDLLFYYSISFLFLTRVKNLTASTILLGDSFYYIFKIIFQLPCVNIVELMGKLKALKFGNLLIIFSIIWLIASQGLSALIISNLFMAIGFSIKSLCECSILDECVSNCEKPRSVFSRIDAKGSAYYYYFDAITSVFCGFLFVFNNYLPVFMCLIFCIVSFIVSCKFLPYENSDSIIKLNETGSFKQYFKDLNIAFKGILKSNRLKALLLFSGFFFAIIKVRTTVANELLVEIGVSEEYFGIIFAFLTILSGFASKTQEFFHKKLRNKLLSYFSITFSICMIIAGLCAIVLRNSLLLFIIIVSIYAIWNIIRAPYYTLQKRYLNSFSTPSMSSKIYSACTLIESLFNTAVYWIVSFMLKYINISYTMVIIGCIFTVIFIFLSDYMKDKLGLKPEEYKKSDIYFSEVH